jgi:amino acid adenylation domain-containing protein
MSPHPPERTVAFPLSFAQRAIWFMYELQPESPVYHVPYVVRLRGRVDAAALQRSLNWVTGRHEVLRTTFMRLNGELRQVVHPKIEIPLTTVNAPDGASTPALEFCLRPFDLREEPPLRCALITEAPDEHVLLLVLHHIACDGSSLPVLLGDLSTCYAELLAGRLPSVGELPIQYGDYAVWQRGQAKAGQFAESLSYWERRLAQAPQLALPTDRRPKELSSRGGVLTLLLPRTVMAAADELGHRETATLFMTLLAAFVTLLHRHTGQSDIVVGAPIGNRNHRDLEELIGFFVNPVALRTDVTEDPTFRQLLRRVRQTCLDALSHQDVPFELVVERCDPAHALTRHPLFQVMFMVHWLPSDLLRLPGVSVEPIRFGHQTSKFDLTWNLYRHAESYALEVEYNADLFDAATIDYLARHFHVLLSSAVAQPDRRLSELALNDGAERHRIVTEWNDTTTTFPTEASVHELFEAQAVHTPDAVAIVDGVRQLTYGALDRKANRLAHRLVGCGVGPDTPVVLFLGQSTATFVAMLAVLKACGAYVPLDPDAPQARLEALMADVAAPVVVTTVKLARRLPKTEARLVVLDRAAEARAIARLSSTPVAARAASGQLAYIMYTSGSTGTPKGVEIPHRAISRLVKETNYIRLDGTDSVAQVLNLCFDGSTFETWGALLNGGRLVLFPKALLLSPDDFAAQITGHRVSVVLLTTTLLNLVARHVPWAFDHTRTVLFGGEAVTPSCVKSILDEGGPERLLHIYGPTETTTFATWHHVVAVAATATNVPIGAGIANTQVYLLDRRLEPVAIGVTGELYIGGDGNARGYHGAPGLTADRFVPSPFGADGQRLYRSGDICRWRPDGALEFLRRVDGQLKLRGARVEPREIESALLAHPYVAAAVVIVRGDGDRRLVAYVVSGNGARLEPAELRQFIARKLPAFMVPAAFVFLDSFPLSTNGKVDHERLPAPKSFVATVPHVTPQTRIEEILVVLWSELLGVQGIGRHDDFLDLGGNSQLASEAIYRIEEIFQVALPLTAIYDYSTIAELATCVEVAGRVDNKRTARTNANRRR